ncbi:TrbL/VirB6 family protein [Wolbachia endosymbiont of Pentidionis agamae]|uniref:type IV secretion system protein n=1 Tax=Wolbachia endosymbiont of Pentidionis agamae TaxID=3110435 RepID=UPI002FCF59D5
MFKIKSILLLAAILLLNIDFLIAYSVSADEITGSNDTEIVSRFNSQGEAVRATDPNCALFKTAAVIASIAILIGVVWTAVVLIVSSAGLFTAIVIAGTIAAVVGLWKAIGGLIVCEHSFVRHPVIRDDAGKYKDFKLHDQQYDSCTDKNYEKEEEYFKCLKDKIANTSESSKSIETNIIDLNLGNADSTDHYYWPKNRTQYSQHIEICHRKPITFGSIFDEITDFDPREKELNIINKRPWSNIDGALRCEALKAGEEKWIHGAKFKAFRRMGRLCVDLTCISSFGISMSAWPQGEMGCTDLPPSPPAPQCEKSKAIFKNTGGQESELSIPGDQDYLSFIKEKEKAGQKFIRYNNEGCFEPYVSKACFGVTKSLSPLPMTSMVVQCIKESLENLVAGVGAPNGESFLSVAQKRLKNTVTALLVLALILFSIKVIAGGVQHGPQELYMLIIKFALVMFFTTGDTMSKYYKDYLLPLSNGLSNKVLQASSEQNGVCDYKSQDYETSPRGESYSYLMAWDRLDCRMLFYLGAPLQGIGGKIGTGGIAASAVLLGFAPLLALIGAIIGVILAGGQILTCLVAIFMVIMLIMTVLWMVYIFILSLIALSVIIILSPIFIPMCLFQVTKGYFDGWIREVITYSLYPVILFAFLSFMFIACDKLYFGNLKFERDPYRESGNQRVWFKLGNTDNCENNKDTLACMLQNYEFKKGNVLGIFYYSYIEFKDSILGQVLKLALVLFLFFHFLNVLPGMAAELAGNTRASLGNASVGNMTMGALSAGLAIASAPGQVAKAIGKKIAAAKGSGGEGGGTTARSGATGGKSSESIKPTGN